MVGARRHGLAQLHIDGLVVHGGVRQAQRDQVVDRIDVRQVSRIERQGRRPVHYIGRGGRGRGLEPDRGFLAIGGEAAVGGLEQVLRRPEAVDGRTSAAAAGPDHLARGQDGVGIASEARRIGVAKALDLLLAIKLFRRTLGVGQGGLIDDVAGATGRGRTIERLRPQADLAGVDQQVPAVGGDAGPFRQRQIEPVDADRSHDFQYAFAFGRMWTTGRAAGQGGRRD
ncbi:hypothetical protein D3C73_1114820 [compost metagenome]